MINCKYFEDNNLFFRGFCLKKNEIVSYGNCINLCKICSNTKEELNEYITKTKTKTKTIIKSTTKKSGGCSGCSRSKKTK